MFLPGLRSESTRTIVYEHYPDKFGITWQTHYSRRAQSRRPEYGMCSNTHMKGVQPTAYSHTHTANGLHVCWQACERV